MTGSAMDRRNGVIGGRAFKVPCKSASTAALTLSGQQTVDGVALVAGDRCLVKDQSDTTTNGVYVVDTGAWYRDYDFDGNLDILFGTLIFINSGTTNGGNIFKVTSADPITIGTSALTFSNYGGGGGGGGGVTSFNSRTGAITTIESDIATGLGAKRVVFIGDSLWAQNSLLSPSVPECFRRMIEGLGCPVIVHNLSLDGYTFYRANGNGGYLPFNGQSVVQQAINLAPDLIFVGLGYNDVINAQDGRSNANIEADATTLFSALHTALPNAKLVYVSELGYDSGNFTPSVSLKNKGVTPNWFALKAAGILTGYYTSEVLEDAVAAATKTLFTSWVTVDGVIAALGTINANIVMNYWRVARLGCTGLDKVHPSAMGCILLAGYLMKGLRGTSFAAAMFPNLASNVYPIWEEPDSLFANLMTASSDGWTSAYGSVGETLSKQTGPFHLVYPDSWYMPSKGRLTVTGNASVTSDLFSIIGWTITNGQPNSLVSASLDGGAFTSTAVTTDGSGFAQGVIPVGALQLSAGAHTYRYLCGGESFGPVTITVAATTEPYFLGTRATTQNAPALSWQQVSIDNTISDNRSGLITGNYRAPIPGKYMVTGSVALDQIPVHGFVGCAIYKNGTEYIDGTYFNNGSTAPNLMTSHVSGIIACSSGDTIGLYVYNGSTSALNISPGSGNVATNWSVKWIGY